MRAMKLLLPILVFLGSSGCTEPVVQANHRRTTGVEGIWDARFQGADSNGRDVEVMGVVVLYPSPWVRESRGITDSTVLQGVYDADFRAFGFDPRRGFSLPEASGRQTEPGRFEVRLNPYVSQGGVMITARLSSDSLLGEWYREFPLGAKGTVVLTRK